VLQHTGALLEHLDRLVADRVGANVFIGAANGVIISAYFLARNLLVHSYYTQGGPLSLATVPGAGGVVSEILGTLEFRITSALLLLFFFPSAGVVPQRVDRGGALHLRDDVGDPAFAEVPASFAGVERDPVVAECRALQSCSKTAGSNRASSQYQTGVQNGTLWS
jgi:hypothetical protein